MGRITTCRNLRLPKPSPTEIIYIFIVSADASTQTAARLQTLSGDFTTLQKDETFSDVKLICENRTLSAHRCVLSARSEVFAAMFRCKMAETESGVVHIKDMDPDVLELLLKYVYSGQIPELSESTARRLYKASDKYAVHSLRDTCSEWMVEYQDPENCLDLLVLADEHSDEKFMEAVVCFTAEHLPWLSVASWTAFKEKYPLLALPVLEKRLADSLPRDRGIGKSSDTMSNIKVYIESIKENGGRYENILQNIHLEF